jgi:SAM-dependent methyltransferase
MTTARERETYESVWGMLPTYGDHAPGEQHLALFQEMAGAASGSVLDAGCGSGKGALALAAAGFDVTLCDITPDGLVDQARRLRFVNACLWSNLPTVLPASVDYVYCCDVLEHIPTEYSMLVLRRLLDVADRGVFLSIALVPDQFGVWVGKPLHQTVRPFTWWRDRLRDIGELVECRDLLTTGVYFARKS